MKIYGHLGTMNKKDGKAQCHLCGLWFLNVGLHISRGHKMDCSDYREMFGLSRCYPLAGDEFSNRQRKNHSARLRTYKTKGTALIKAMTAEERKPLSAIPRRESTRIKNSEARKRENAAARLQKSPKRLPALLASKERPEYRKKLSDARKRWEGNKMHMEKMRKRRWAKEMEGGR